MPFGAIVAWGVICLIVSIAAVVFGITRLAISAKKPSGTKKLLGIIIGLILIVVGSGFALTSGVFILSSDWISKAPTAADTANMVSGIQDSLENNDSDALAKLFAPKGYSGETLDNSDAEQMFSCIEGNITETQFTVSGVAFEGNTHASSYVFTIKTDASKEYTIYFDFILASDNEEYIGIQHIKLLSDGQVQFEAGIEPELETHS